MSLPPCPLEWAHCEAGHDSGREIAPQQMITLFCRRNATAVAKLVRAC